MVRNACGKQIDKLLDHYSLQAVLHELAMSCDIESEISQAAKDEGMLNTPEDKLLPEAWKERAKKLRQLADDIIF